MASPHRQRLQRLVRIERYDADRQALWPLFALADDSAAQIAVYLPLGEVWVARDGDLVVGHVQIVEAPAGAEFEIKSLSVIEKRRGEGIGRRLVEAALDRCRQRRGHRVIVATATVDIGNLRFYQRQGFRMFKVVQDAFGPATGYAEGMLVDGMPLRDQVVLENLLSSSLT